MMKVLLYALAYLGLCSVIIWYLIEYHDHDDHWMA